MRKILLVMIGLLLMTAPLLGQAKRLWVLRPPGEMVEYDPATFAVKQIIKVPAEAVESPGNILVNRAGQILYEAPVSLPLSEEDAESAHKVWFWNGRAATTPAGTSAATTIDQDVKREVTTTGSNQAVTESAAVAYLSAAADGGHLFWSANQARRLQREDVSLSTATTWQAWRTDLSGAEREDLATSKFPDCKCPTGTCDESCPYGVVWAPDTGVDKFFLMTQFVTGQTAPVYKASARYREKGGKWSAEALSEPLQRVLDATADGGAIVEAIPDTGCCGWSNQSNDLTLVLSGETLGEKKITVFDEQATYKNPDYDVSFYTSNARLSPELGYVAMTIVSTAQENKAIQLAQEGQANPEESQRIRKALAELPAVEVKRMLESPERVAFVPHAVLVGWINEKEILIIEDHVLVAYNVGTGARRKSSVRVEDAGRVFLR
ncbi:MAG: hypothetical protein ABSE44_04875 [Candidatus Sulfotelmatobacter sp.]|jgi:hypothetical protein